MARAKIGITIDEASLKEVDGLVAAGEFANRSRALQAALDCLRDQRSRKQRLLRELANLDPAEERALADEWLDAESDWPAF